MKTRGIQNAIQRLAGARKLGSPALQAQTEQEGQHILTQARAWLARTPRPPAGAEHDPWTPVAQAVEQLAQALEIAGKPAQATGDSGHNLGQAHQQGT